MYPYHIVKPNTTLSYSMPLVLKINHNYISYIQMFMKKSNCQSIVVVFVCHYLSPFYLFNVLLFSSIFRIQIIIFTIVRTVHVMIMVNVFDTSIIQQQRDGFVNVRKDGLVDIVIFLTIVHVHLIRCVWGSWQILDQSVFVLQVDGVHDVSFMIKCAVISLIHVRMVVNAYLLTLTCHPTNNSYVFVKEDTRANNVKYLHRPLHCHWKQISSCHDRC